MTTSKIPIRYKLVVSDKIQLEIIVKYLGINIAVYSILEDVRRQTTKAIQTATCLNNIVSKKTRKDKVNE